MVGEGENRREEKRVEEIFALEMDESKAEPHWTYTPRNGVYSMCETKIH